MTTATATLAQVSPDARALPALAAPALPRATAPIPALFGLALAVPTAIGMVLVSSLIGPFIMFAIPFMLLFGCVFGPLHAMVRGEL